MTHYIDYLSKEHNFREKRIEFDSYESALNWMQTHIDIENWNIDIIKCY